MDSTNKIQIASVDYETDRQIQDTIATQFADRTILCIARAFSLLLEGFDFSSCEHVDRLRTIIAYDRVVSRIISK